MNAPRRRWRATGAVLVAMLVGGIRPPAAGADLYMVFAQPTARPGDRVEIATTSSVVGRPRILVYLVPAYLAKQNENLRPTGRPGDARWRPIGRLMSAARATGDPARISFVLPRELPPGDYTTGFWCRPCAPPQGATFTSAKPGQRWAADARLRKIIRVLAPLEPIDGGPQTPGSTAWATWAVAGAGALILAAAVTRARVRRG